MAKPRRSRTKRILQNAFSLSGAEILSRFFTWLTILYLAREWSLAYYGQYALAVNWITLFAGFSGLGLNGLAIREVSYSKGLTSKFLRNITLLRTLLSLVLILVLALIAWGLDYEATLRAALVVLSLRLLLDAPASAYTALLQAHERMGVQGLVSVGSAFLRAAAILGVVLLGGGMVGVGWVWVVVAAFSCLALWRMGAHLGWGMQWRRFRWPEAWAILVQSVPFASFGIFQMFYYRIDSILLKGFSGNEAVALYDVAGRLLFVVFMVSDHFGVSTLPALSAAQDDPRDMGRMALRSLKALLLLGLPLTVGGVLLADPLMTLLFGEKYAASGPLFAVLSLSILFHFATKPFVNILAIRNPASLTLIFSCLLAVNLVANFYAIPRWGPMGAALVWVGCEVLLLLVTVWPARRSFPTPGASFYRGLMGAAAAAALMGLAIHWDPRLYWLVLGPVVYAGGLLLFGALDRNDRSSLRFLLGRR